MADAEPAVLDYEGMKAALQRLVGRRVIARVDDLATGAGVADIGIGYLQAPSELGEYPGDYEVTAYLITEQAEPNREFRHPLWPSVSVHNVPDFRGWDYGTRVTCTFNGIRVSVESNIFGLAPETDDRLRS